MSLYELISGILTVIGYIILVYRIVHLLSGGRVKKQRMERLCAKWLVFAIFLKLEDYLVVIIDIVPLGKLILLLFKTFLFLPDNSISHSIYKRVHKSLERIKLQEYHSHGVAILSFVCTLTVGGLLILACRLATLIDLGHIEDVERRILDIIKVLEYKRTAISMRRQAPASNVNQQLNSSEFNSSLLEEESPIDRIKEQRTELGSQMNKILTGGDNGRIRARVEVMIAKPNRAAKQKAKYATIDAEYECTGSKLTLKSRGGEESWTLREIRWITKNMLNIQAVFAQGGSRILRVKDPNDVVRWIQPVCANLQRLQQQLSPHAPPQIPQQDMAQST